MSTIHIRWLSDYHDCETCGSSYAEGAIVSVDGEQVIELEPVAHCFGGNSYGSEAVYAALLQHLGHTVTEEHSE